MSTIARNRSIDMTRGFAIVTMMALNLQADRSNKVAKILKATSELD